MEINGQNALLSKLRICSASAPLALPLGGFDLGPDELEENVYEKKMNMDFYSLTTDLLILSQLVPLGYAVPL